MYCGGRGRQHWNGRQRPECEMKTNTYRAPRTVTMVEPKFVTKTPHRSMAGTTEAGDMATIDIILLTPLNTYDEQNVKSGRVCSSLRMGRYHDLGAVRVYGVHIVCNNWRENYVHLSSWSRVNEWQDIMFFPPASWAIFFIMRSETRPAIGCPTFHINGEKDWWNS